MLLQIVYKGGITLPKSAINNNHNMKLIRKRMVDLDIYNIDELAIFLYTAPNTLRGKLNGRIKVRYTELVYIEKALNIGFVWNLIKKIRLHLV